MKFTILKEELEQALNVSGRAISGRAARPILSALKMEMNDNGLFLTSSDGYISIVTKIPLETRDGKSNITLFDTGVAVIGARNLTEIIRKFSGSKLQIEMVENNILQIKDNVSDFSLICIDPNEYPMIDINTEGLKISLKCADFVDGVDKTSYATSEREPKPELQGVNISSDTNSLVFTATDRFRIARKTINIQTNQKFSVTIPTKVLTDVAKISESYEDLEMVVAEKKALFKFENTLVVVQVIAKEYPSLDKLIPTTFTSRLITDPSHLATSIDRTSTLSSDRCCIVRLSMSNEELKVMSKSQEIGSGNDTIQAYQYFGDKLDISFTSKYIIEALKSLGNDDVELVFNGDAKPVVIKSTKDDSTICLLLPYRTY